MGDFGEDLADMEQKSEVIQEIGDEQNGLPPQGLEAGARVVRSEEQKEKKAEAGGWSRSSA